MNTECDMTRHTTTTLISGIKHVHIKTRRRQRNDHENQTDRHDQHDRRLSQTPLYNTLYVILMPLRQI